MAIDMTELRPYQRKMAELLSDGEAHHVDAIRQMLPNPKCDGSVLTMYVSKLRKQVERFGHEIVTERRSDGTYYRLALRRPRFS